MHNDPTENAFKRENSRLAGFGPGMASALIGNPGRRGNSLVVNDVKDHRKALGSIGWGLTNPQLDQGVWRRLLPEMPHKKQYDFDGLKYLPHMDTTGKFALHLDNQLGIPYDMMDELSVREQRVIIKRRMEEIRQVENYKIRNMSKSPTRAIDTTTNTKLYIKQMERRNQNQQMTQTFQTQFERRSRSNLPYAKKGSTQRSSTSEFFGDQTTAATASPTLRNALSIQYNSEMKQGSRNLQEVTEFPFPKNAITNEYRKTRLLKKGCPKLLKLVDKHQVSVEKSIAESDRLSQRLHSNVDRVKMSIMTTRTYGQPINLANTMEERSFNSGFNTSKNAYVKSTLNKTHKNNQSGPPIFPSMGIDRSEHRNNLNISEMKNIEKPQMVSKAHVPKLLLTQANQFQTKKNHVTEEKGGNHNNLMLDSNATGIQTTVGDSIMVNSPQVQTMFGSQESPMMHRDLNNTAYADAQAARIADSQEGGVNFTNDTFSYADSPTKKQNPLYVMENDSVNDRQINRTPEKGFEGGNETPQQLRIDTVAIPATAEAQDNDPIRQEEHIDDQQPEEQLLE